jgi:predicted glutamine amidotransferase
MHNGDLGDFALLRRQLLASLGDAAFQAIEGTTDSEHLFALVIDELPKAAGNGAERLANALEAAIARAVLLGKLHGHGAPSYLNVAFSDGECAVASRYTTEPDYDGESLYVHTGRLYVCTGGVCKMLAPERGRGCVLVSSEPLSDDPGWDMLPRNSLVLIHHDGTTSARPLGG